MSVIKLWGVWGFVKKEISIMIDHSARAKVAKERREMKRAHFLEQERTRAKGTSKSEQEVWCIEIAVDRTRVAVRKEGARRKQRERRVEGWWEGERKRSLIGGCSNATSRRLSSLLRVTRRNAKCKLDNVTLLLKRENSNPSGGALGFV